MINWSSDLTSKISILIYTSTKISALPKKPENVNVDSRYDQKIAEILQNLALKIISKITHILRGT